MKKQNKAKTAKLAFYLAIMLLCLTSAAALGIRPVKTEIDFQERYHGSFKVVNNDHARLRVKIYAEGDLADYIELPETELEFEPGEEMKSVPFSLKLDEKQLIPGKVEGRIVVEEQLYSKPTVDGYVAANLKMAHKVYVNVPYPEKYIEAKIEVEEQEQDVDLTTIVKNMGTQDLEEIKSTLTVYSGEEEIESSEHETDKLDVKEEQSFKSSVLKEKLGIGEFKVLNTIDYEEFTLELIEVFTLGKPLIEILNYDKYFIENKINELAVDIKSEWNTIIKGAFLELFVFKDNQEVFTAKTTSFDLEPYEQKQIGTYFDTRNLELGEYDVNLVLHYQNQSTVESYKANIMSEQDYLRLSKGNKLIYLLTTVIVLLIAVAALLIYYILRVKTKKFKYPSRKNKK